ncbi:hypothetical protein [Egicoccus sp. AB-alg6-2]|uniref:hypothetical protein n=1 Tax=Egicoccus sp. AB-alg6-2 TaxID=3242692 RepID=UPI00359EEC3C
MRTKLMIAVVVLAVVAAALGVTTLLVFWLGPLIGLSISVVGAVLVCLGYHLVVRPWQRHWGATDDEVARTMPGDDVVARAAATTRAVTIEAAPEQIWPWLVQVGYGRAGWYSYDWIDNDGRPSADQIYRELQDLQVGDRLELVPGMGPQVRDLQPNQWLLCGDAARGTWCLALYPLAPHRTRLVSRWRMDWQLTPANVPWILVSDPGTFIMERRMLHGIRDRAERMAANERFLKGAVTT